VFTDSIFTSVFCNATAPSGPGPPHYWGFTITLRHTSLGRTPLDEWSARRSDLYLTTHNTHKGQISMLPVAFKPRNPSKRDADLRLRPRGYRNRHFHYCSDDKYQTLFCTYLSAIALTDLWQRQWRYNSAYLLFFPTTRTSMRGRIHEPFSLSPVKEPSPKFAHCIRGWEIPTACLEVRANPLSRQN